MANKKFIQKAIPASHKGRLHEALGVPEGQKIPASKMQTALHSSDVHIKKMAQLAKTLSKLHK